MHGFYAGQTVNNFQFQKKEVLQLAAFKLNVAVSVMKSGQTCQSVRRGRPSRIEPPKLNKKNCATTPDDVRLDQVAHLPQVGVKRQRCRVQNCPEQTKIYCRKCKAHLCLDMHKNCFASFHGLKELLPSVFELSEL